jgi:two-component system nitrogen regulation response regulator GlnG
MPRALVVDDDRAVQHLVKHVLEANGWQVAVASNESAMRAEFDNAAPDVVLLDLLLPDTNGLDLFRQIQERDRKLPVIFITAHGGSDAAIEAVKGGAYDYLHKPLDVETLSKVVESAWEIRRLMTTPVDLPTHPSSTPQADVLLGRSPKMLEVYKAIGRVADQDVTVLILGESGTGKELVARAIYQHSRRAKGPFLAVNCGALHETLLESELFGHEKGSFTGADQRRIGKFEHCSNGTIFLDEIGDTSLAVQVKLLRVLQQQQFERIGGNSTITVDTRVIAATNRDLDALVVARQFREDLLYRLNGFTIRIPPLRERLDDIPLLVENAVARFSDAMRKNVLSISANAMELLQAYSWPGNVRELQSVVRQAILHAQGPVLLPEHIPVSVTEGIGKPVREGIAAPTVDTLTNYIRERLRAGSSDLYAETIERMDRALLPAVLEHTHGNQSTASKILGITRGSLRTKLRALGITVSQIVQTESPDEEAFEMPHAGNGHV